MKRFAALSIGHKITLIVMATTCVALLVSLAAVSVFAQVSFRERMRRETITRAEIIANNSTAALSFGDPAPVSEILRALSADPHLGVAAVFDAQDKVFAQYSRPGWTAPRPAKLPAYSTK